MAGETGVTETQAAAIDVVAAILQKELIQKAILLPSIMDYSAWVKAGAKSVKIPRAGSFTAGDKVENTASSVQTLTLATDDLDLTIYKHIFAEVEDIAKDQSAVDIEAVYIERMASAMVDAVESSIAGVLVKAANDRQLTGTSNLILTAADILASRQALDDAHCPQTDRFLAFPPAQEAAMLGIDNFVSAEKYGSSEPVQNGELGRVFGFRCIKSTSFASDSEYCAYHKSHAAFAKSQEVKFEKKRASLSHLADELSLSMIYAVKQMDSGNRGQYADESAE